MKQASAFKRGRRTRPQSSAATPTTPATRSWHSSRRWSRLRLARGYERLLEAIRYPNGHRENPALADAPLKVLPAVWRRCVLNNDGEAVRTQYELGLWIQTRCAPAAVPRLQPPLRRPGELDDAATQWQLAPSVATWVAVVRLAAPFLPHCNRSWRGGERVGSIPERFLGLAA